MCGIAGLLGVPAVGAQRLIENMCHRLVHRGPDAAGYYVRDGVALGHRRLSIIDVTGGDQPIGNEDNSIQIIFNGEIYNFQELAEDLSKRGHRFRTRSDTETIVHLYEEYGERTPEYLNGMFAFAIWDSRKKTLFLARDRFGEKPLYYTTGGEGLRFAFASEMKALLEIPGLRRRVNPQALADYFALSYVPDPQTIYEHVHKLEAGCSLMITPDGIRHNRYWRLEFQPDPSANLEKSSEELRGLSQEAVTRRLMSDVPLGAFLSGGVDSSAVAGYMARTARSSIKTFSIGFTERAFDESEYARQMAKLFHTRHSEKTVELNIGEMLPVLVRHYDEPFADASAVPTLYLSRLTREHVTVSLSGDGADELFGGYRRYCFGVNEDRVRGVLPRWFRQSAIRSLARVYPKFDYLPQIFRAKATLTCLSQELGFAYFSAIASALHGGLAARLFSPELKARLGGYSAHAQFASRFEKFSHLPALQQMQAVDLETYLPGDILVKVDRATMAYSLESRAPWLDPNIAALAARMPTPLQVRGREGKYLWKKSLAGMLPDSILWRRKMGFSVPLPVWFRGPLKPLFEDLMAHRDIGEFFAPQVLREMWREHQSGTRNWGREFWVVLMFWMWRQHHHAGLPALADVETVGQEV